MRVRIIHDLSELELLAATLEVNCIDTDMSPTQDPIWALSCAEAFADDNSLAAVAIEDDTGLLALAPMARNSGVLNGYELLGVKELTEPTDFFYVDELALEALVGALSGSRRLVTLGRICIDSKSVAAMRRAFPRKGTFLTSRTSNYPFIAFDEIGKNVDKVLSGGLRSDLRRARRKAESLGAISFEVHVPRSDQEFSPLFNCFLEVEKSGWKGRSGSALALDTVRQTFFRVYGLRAAKKGVLRMAFMRIGPDIAAAQFAVQTGGRFWLLKVGHDEKYSVCSPGLLLIYETLRYATQQRLQSYEFLGHSAPWLERWTSSKRTTIRIEACRSRTKCFLILTNRILTRMLLKLRRILEWRR